MQSIWCVDVQEKENILRGSTKSIKQTIKWFKMGHEKFFGLQQTVYLMAKSEISNW